MIKMSLRRTFIAAKGVAVAFDSGSGDAVASSPGQRRRRSENEPLQDDQANDDACDDHAPCRA